MQTFNQALVDLAKAGKVEEGKLRSAAAMS
jgi:hypothetical protein